VEEFNLILELENKQSKARKPLLFGQGYRVVHFKQDWEIFLQRLWYSLFKENDGKMIPISSSNSQSAWSTFA